MLIKNGRIIDPANNIDTVMDVFIEDEKIIKVDKNLEVEKNSVSHEVIDAKGCWVIPGAIDLHVHLREPGLNTKKRCIPDHLVLQRVV